MEAHDITLPPPQDSPKNIINILNDDCLKEVLLKLEHEYDFVTVAKVCTRFLENAKMCFPYRTMCFGPGPSQQQRDAISFNDAVNFLSLFGSRIKSIKCYLLNMNPLEHDDFLNSIAKYCGQTLTELEITNGNIRNLEKPFKSLKNLILNECSWQNCDPAVIFPELKALRVSNLTYMPPRKGFTKNIDWLVNNIPKLEHITFREITSNLIIEFQNHNPQLKSIDIDQQIDDFTLSLWENTVDRMPNIESFYLFNMKAKDTAITKIGTLPRLKDLDLFLYRDTDMAIVKTLFSNSLISKQPIENLKIEYVDNELGIILQNMKTLKTLFIQGSAEDISFEFINHLPALQYLRIYHPSLSTVQNILQNAEKLVQLKIYLGPLSNVDFDLETYKSIIALATDRVKVIIFYAPLSRSQILNNREKDILHRVSNIISEWVRFQKYCYWSIIAGPFQYYPRIRFD